MSSITQIEHQPGVFAFRAEGILSERAVHAWRDALKAAAAGRQACGFLLDVTEVTGLSTQALDAALATLAEIQTLVGQARTRFALIGFRPYTLRFMQDVLPAYDRIRAKPFSQEAEAEALAWLAAMVTLTSGPDTQ
ncbi:MAG: hypothetical protein GYB64_19160 [Chloroflexi bacterium]|nr:hypothetical protein [Chloroflexota bacterium]